MDPKKRLELLRDFLDQAGKRLSSKTVDAINDAIAKLTELIGEAEPESDAVEQAFALPQSILCQAMVTGISVADTYDSLILRVGKALTRDDTLPGSRWSRWSVYTHPEWVVFSVWIDEYDEYHTYIADYTDDGETITFGDVRPASIESVVKVIETVDLSELDQAVTYADPEGKKYPIDTKAHAKAAWSYINMPRNASKYGADKLATVKNRIKAACKKFGVEVSDQAAQPNGFAIEQGDGKLPILVQSAQITNVRLQEQDDGSWTFGGTATVGNIRNCYDQVYPTSLWAGRGLTQANAMIASGTLVGSDGHKQDATGRPRLPDPSELVCLFQSVSMSGDEMRFEAKGINSQVGKDVKAALEAGVALEMSTRVCGTTKKEKWTDGKQAYIVQDNDDFELLGIDVVVRGASPGSTIDHAKLQASMMGHTEEDSQLNEEEIKKLIEQALESRDDSALLALQAELKDIKEAMGQSKTLTEAQEKTLAQAAEIVAKNDAMAIVQARDAKVKEVLDAMVQAKELPKQLLQSATTLYQGMATTEAEVETKKPQLLSVIAPMLEQHEHLQTLGFYAPEYEEDGTKKGNIESLDQGVNELLDSLEVRGLVQKYEHQSVPYEGPDGEKLRDFRNMRQNLYAMCEMVIQQHPEIGAAYFKLRNGEMKTLTQSHDLMSAAGAKQLMLSADGTTTGDIAAALPYVLPMMLEIFPQLLVQLFATMQPIQKSGARIYYVKHRYDDDDAQIANVANFTGSYTNNPGENTQVKYINAQITSEDITTDIKKLGWKASAEVLRNLSTDFGIDGRSDLIRMCAALIAMEWNYNHLCNIIDGATGGTQTYGKAIPANSSFDGEQWQRQIHRFCQNVRSQIWKKTFCESVFWFGDSDSIDRLIDAQERGQYTANGRGQIARGVDIVGTLSTGETLVKVGWLETIRGGNKLVCCGRGTTWPETGYIIAPRLGLYVTPEWTNPDTQQTKQSMLSEVADKMVNGDYFGTLTITTDPGVPL